MAEMNFAEQALQAAVGPATDAMQDLSWSWCKLVKHISIQKWGSESDKASQVAASYRNRQHATKSA